MPTTLAIRPAKPDDLDTIVDFNLRLARESESKDLCPQTLRFGVEAALADAGLARYFVACHDDRPVGQIMLTREWSDWRNGHIWWIQSVYVVAEFRGQGIYRAMHDHVRRQAMADPKVVGLRLYVEENNHIAQQVYQRAALKTVGYFVMEEMFPG